MGRNWMFNRSIAPGMTGNQPEYVLTRWQHPGDVTDIERFTMTSGSDAYSSYSYAVDVSDKTISDASYIRLKNLSLSYTIAESVLHQIGMKKGTIYFQSQNLLTFTRYKGIDPENNLSPGSLPPLRILSLGIRVNF